MKKRKIVIIIAISFCILITTDKKIYTQNYVYDEIKVFLEEYIEGEKTNNYLFFYFRIYKKIDNEEIKWSMIAQYYESYITEKKIYFDMKYSSDDDFYDYPLVENIKWDPRKRIECDVKLFGLIGGEFKLIAIKIKNKWKVKGVGEYRICDSCKPQKREFIEKKEIKLKHKKIILNQ